MAQGGFTRGFVLGLAVGVVTPLAVTALAVGTRPLGRALRRGGGVIGDKIRETAAELSEIVEDMVAEARAEQHARFEQREVPRRPTPAGGRAGGRSTA